MVSWLNPILKIWWKNSLMTAICKWNFPIISVKFSITAFPYKPDFFDLIMIATDYWIQMVPPRRPPLDCYLGSTANSVEYQNQVLHYQQGLMSLCISWKKLLDKHFTFVIVMQAKTIFEELSNNKKYSYPENLWYNFVPKY